MTNYANLATIINNANALVPVSSGWVDVSKLDKGSIQVSSFSVGLVGNLKLQATNDPSMIESDLAGTSVTFTAPNGQLYTFPFGFSFKWIRVVFTPSSFPETAVISANLLSYDDN